MKNIKNKKQRIVDLINNKKLYVRTVDGPYQLKGVLFTVGEAREILDFIEGEFIDA